MTVHVRNSFGLLLSEQANPYLAKSMAGPATKFNSKKLEVWHLRNGSKLDWSKHVKAKA